MGRNENTKTFATIGLILIIVSLIIGIWISVENRNSADELSEDSDKRTGFFYDKNLARGEAFAMDSIYVFAPTPGHSGFNFFLLMAGITFIMYAFYKGISSGDPTAKNLADSAVAIMILSLVLAAFVSYMNYTSMMENHEEEPDEDLMRDNTLKAIFFQYLNAALVFLSPALLLFAIFKERLPNPEDQQKYLVYVGLVIVIVSLVFAIVSGFYARKMIDHELEDLGDYQDFAGWNKNKAFISSFFPYMSYLGIGMMLFPFAQDYTKKKFTSTTPTSIVTIGLIILIVGVMIALYPSLKYHNFASTFKDLTEGDLSAGDDYDTTFEDYMDSTMYLYIATGISFLGIGLILFSVVYGHYLQNAVLSNEQKMNIGFLIMIVAALVMGSYAGYIKTTEEDFNPETFFMLEYLFMVLLFSSTGLMMYTWTRNLELFAMVKHLCPDCGEEVEFNRYYRSFYCETCNELLDEPIEKEIKNCPDCSGEMDFYEEYRSWYCPICGEYKRIRRKRPARSRKKRPAPRRGGPGRRPAGARPRPAAGYPESVEMAEERPRTIQSRSRRPVRGSPEGGRTPKCRDCGQRMTFIQQYDRWYCYPCQRYGGVPGASGGGSPRGTKKRSRAAGGSTKRSKASGGSRKRTSGGAKKRPSGGKKKKKGGAGKGKKKVRAGEWEVFSCPTCGKSGEVKTHKRPLTINCSECGHKSVLK